MKKLVGHDIGTYTFDKTAKTVTLSGIPPITLEQILLITNTTSNTIIYNFAVSGLGGTYVPGTGVLTLAFNTGSMNNTDNLQIFIDVTTNGAVPLLAEYKSPDDFTAAYTSSSTITVSNLPFTVTDSSQIRYIKQITTTNLSNVYFNGYNGCTMQIVPSTGVITIYGVGTPFLSGDVYEVGFSGVLKAYDATLDITKTIDQSPTWTRRTDVESLLSSAYTLTTSFANLGPVVDCRGYETIAFFIKCTVQQSTNIQFKLLAYHTYGGSEAWSIPIELVSSGLDTISTEIVKFPDSANFLYILKAKVDNVIPYLQAQVMMGTDGGTDGTIDTFYVTKGY